jgi:nucleotide-binding universal stress UspA family protein
MFTHLLATLDGSPRSEAVIPHSISIATSMRAEITLLRIVDAVSADWSERGALGPSQLEAASRNAFAEQAHAYLERVATPIRQRGIIVNVLVRQGTAAKQIVQAAQDVDADAIAMATHSRRGLNRLVFGSVAEEVLHAAQVPVLLVPAA